MRVDLYTDPQAFGSLRAEWADLVARSSYNTLFLRPEWMAAWWQVFGPEGALRLLAVRGDDGRLLGVAPLFLAAVDADPSQPLPALSFERPRPNPAATPQPTLLLVGGTEVTDYTDILVEPEHAPAVIEAIFAALLERVPGWRWLDLHNIPDGSPTLGLLTRLAEQHGLAVELGQEEVCPFISLPASWDEYLASLGKKERHELRRKMRNIEQAGRVHLLEVTAPAQLEGSVETFMALHEASTPDKASFMRDPRMRRFFRLITRMAIENGWLDLSFLAIDDQPAAGILCFHYGDGLLVYNSGCDPQAWPGLSPGIALLGHCIRKAIDRGLHEFDFLQGSEPYKYDLGARDRPVWRLLIRRE